MKYLLLSITMILFSCVNDDITSGESSVELLDGKWVEIVNRRDTIIFDTGMNGSDSRYFMFKCGKGISGYNNLHSTIYEYRITTSEISIYNTLSSCYCFSDYSYSQTNDKIFIENFYDSGSKGVIETFEKLE
jgi:hypothetical protein